MSYSYRPKGVRYVDMAIWVDANAYKEDCDQEKMYDYIYQLSKMLAYKRGLCQNYQHYEDFALYAASKYFLRITDKRQFELDENGEPKLKRIKSILNYIKKTLYTSKIDFDREYGDSADPDVPVEVDNEGSNFRDILESTVDEIHIAEFEHYLHDVSRTIKFHLQKLPYKRDSAEWLNIYTSCLLSLLNSVTLPRKSLLRLNAMIKAGKSKMSLIDKMYRKERENSTILYHLDESMRDYITVLVNEIRKVIANDLSGILHTHISTASYTSEMMMQTLKGEDDEEY